jgi:hypothetical protein
LREDAEYGVRDKKDQQRPKVERQFKKRMHAITIGRQLRLFQRSPHISKTP